jgi:diguanylate cyclase (GGDEF)-like protein
VSRGELSAEEVFEFKLLFLRELAEGHRRARAAHDKFLKDPRDVIAIRQIRDFFHRVAGTAWTVQLELLGYVAVMAERTADELARGPIANANPAAQTLSDALAAVAFVLDEHGTTASAVPRPSHALEGYDGLVLLDGIGEGRELSKILVIDDDPFSAALVDHCLRGAGFISSYCCDPMRALGRIEEELPDLVVMDVAMPGIDGFELCRRIRQHPAMQFTPIIFVTRKDDVEQRVRGLEVGGNDYIGKPFEPKELVARVRSHLMRLANLREMAIRDGLTRCFNHKFFRMRLDQEVARARRYGHGLAAAMIDVDHFKTINDTHGHPAGDLVLAHLANVIVASLRATDVVARYGGEEFSVCMVHASAKEAAIVCDRLRERVAAHQFALPSDRAETQLTVTVSIGIAELSHSAESWMSLIQRADRALYAAKERGRNRVVVADAS